MYLPGGVAEKPTALEKDIVQKVQGQITSIMSQHLIQMNCLGKNNMQGVQVIVVIVQVDQVGKIPVQFNPEKIPVLVVQEIKIPVVLASQADETPVQTGPAEI
jgi:hypothetical protein